MHSTYRFTRIAAGSLFLASSLVAQGVKPVTPPPAAKKLVVPPAAKP